ncbi:MAG: LysR family transcriptional regulator [Lachnospiraceae bacterium]|nr:LysR family transcriptional regulator [Lachnospiraceae bacterium]
MELRNLEYLKKISDEGTFLAAAESLHVSQPALTRAMQKLEDELGLTLFDRTKNNAKINEAGMLAVECAEDVLDRVAEMMGRMENYKKSLTTLSVGSCAPGPTFELIPRLTSLYPEMTISSVIQPENTLVEGLLNDNYRLIVLSKPCSEENVLCLPYVRESLMVSLPKKNPLAKRDKLYFSDLKGLNILSSTNLGIWQEIHDTKMKGANFIVQPDRKTLHELIAASDLPNFVTNLSKQYVSYVPENRVAIPLDEPDASVQFYICALKKNKKIVTKVIDEP